MPGHSTVRRHVFKSKAQPGQGAVHHAATWQGQEAAAEGKAKRGPKSVCFVFFGFAGRGVDSMGVDRTKVSCTSSPHLQLGYYFKIVESNMKPQS